MPTVKIGSNTYEVYADVAAADDYLLADIELGPVWAGQSADQRAAALVSGTRYIDRQKWSGKKTLDSQPLEWPRDGANGAENGIVPDDIIEASIVIAAQLIQNPATQSSNSGAGQKKVKAGSVEGEFFKNFNDDATKFSARVDDLLRPFFGGSFIIEPPVKAGTCKSAFEGDPFGLIGGLYY